MQPVMLRFAVRIASAAAFAVAIAGTVRLSAAQAAASAPGPAHLIRVNRCDPQRTVGSAVVYGGYGPAYYPAGPFYWRDPYGFRYAQPAIVSDNGTLYLDYVNVAHDVMKTIDFGLVANGRLVAEVRDVGTFSPGAEIKHSFGLSPNVFPLQTGLPRCVPLHIVYADGSTWRNPRLPALQHALYGGH
jgi:hypothetical protein